MANLLHIGEHIHTHRLSITRIYHLSNKMIHTHKFVQMTLLYLLRINNEGSSILLANE